MTYTNEIKRFLVTRNHAFMCIVECATRKAALKSARGLGLKVGRDCNASSLTPDQYAHMLKMGGFKVEQKTVE